MTNIEQIRMAREELTAAFKELRENGYRYGVASFQLRVDAAELSVTRFTSIQGQALVQATQVADENFERAQRLTDQVQENVKQIENLADDVKAIRYFLGRLGYKALRNCSGKIDSFDNGSHVICLDLDRVYGPELGDMA